MKKILIIFLIIIFSGVLIYLPTVKGEENSNYFLISDYNNNSFSIKISKDLLQSEIENLSLLVEYPENLSLTSLEYDKTHITEDNLLIEDNTVTIKLFPNDIINTYLSSDNDFLVFNFSGTSTDIIKITAYLENEEEILEEHQIQAKIEEIEIPEENTDKPNSNMGNIQIEDKDENKQNEISKDESSEKEFIQNSNISVNNNSSYGNSSLTSTINSETVTYDGSSNTYLSSLAIDGYLLNTEFNKTNSTYFVNVTDDITSIDITATAEDSSSDVNIYGADELNSDINKIVISVISEDGSTRNYKIYVIK